MAITTIAKNFDTLCQRPMPDEAKAFVQEKHALKAVAIHAKDFAEQYRGSDKAQKKIAEWLRKMPTADNTATLEEFTAAAARFETTYAASCQDDQVREVRAAKKAFKGEVSRQLSSGASAELIQQDLLNAGVSARVARKVEYWAKKIALSISH